MGEKHSLVKLIGIFIHITCFHVANYNSSWLLFPLWKLPYIHGTYVTLYFFFSIVCWFCPTKLWAPWTLILYFIYLRVPTVISVLTHGRCSVPVCGTELSHFWKLVYNMDCGDFLLFYKKIFYSNFPCRFHTTYNTACYFIRAENVDEHSCSGIHHFFFWTSHKAIDYVSLLESNYLILWLFPFYKFVFLVDFIFFFLERTLFLSIPMACCDVWDIVVAHLFLVVVDPHVVFSWLFHPLFRLCVAGIGSVQHSAIAP